jgi:hypothetical protein
MGRPLAKDVNGINVIGKFTGDAGVKIDFHDGTALRTDGVIVKQRGAKTFKVTRESNAEENLTQSSSQVTCVLQSAEPSAVGQMRLAGYIGGSDTPVYIRKITKRIAIDFSDNKYTWVLVNFDDSTGDQIQLTAI